MGWRKLVLMTCQEVERVLYPYLDGEFQPEERLEIEAHLSGCSACAQRVRREAQLQQALRRAARHAVQTERAPESLRRSVVQSLRHEQRRAQQAQWVRLGAAAAVVVIACGSAWWYLKPQALQHFLADAARHHARELPTEIRGPAESVEQWFYGKLDHRVPVLRLPNAVVSGARISNVQDRPAAYISYERVPETEGAPGRRMGLFVFDDARRDVEAEPLPAVEVGSSHGYNVAVWRDGEIVYELVTDLNESDIRQMLLGQGGRQAIPPSAPASVPIHPVPLP
jgi:mycothiol system anti-sigma-R factor